MDIRVTSYNSAFGGTTVTSSLNGRAAQATVQNASQGAAVAAVRGVQAPQSQSASPTLDRVAGGDNGGYTDSIRGSLVNILA